MSRPPELRFYQLKPYQFQDGGNGVIAQAGTIDMAMVRPMICRGKRYARYTSYEIKLLRWHEQHGDASNPEVKPLLVQVLLAKSGQCVFILTDLDVFYPLGAWARIRLQWPFQDGELCRQVYRVDDPIPIDFRIRKRHDQSRFVKSLMAQINQSDREKLRHAADMWSKAEPDLFNAEDFLSIKHWLWPSP